MCTHFSLPVTYYLKQLTLMKTVHVTKTMQTKPAYIRAGVIPSRTTTLTSSIPNLRQHVVTCKSRQDHCLSPHEWSCKRTYYIASMRQQTCQNLSKTVYRITGTRPIGKPIKLSLIKYEHNV